MRLDTAPVKGEGKLLGNAEYPQFDSVDEAVNHPDEGLGEEAVLDLINAQIKTNARNKLRTERLKGPSKSALRSAAYSDVVQMIVDNPSEYPHLIGNPDAMNEAVEARMEELEKERKAQIAEAIAAGEEADSDED